LLPKDVFIDKLSMYIYKKIQMKKTEFIKSVYANVSTPPSVVLRILIGLNKEGLLPKGSHHKDPDLSWKEICLIIYSVYMCGSTPPAIQKFSAIRKKMQVDDQQLLGGILEALTNANEVKMVFISQRNIIVMKEKENLFFGYANENELEDIPSMVNKAIQVPGFVFRNFAAAIQMNRSAILN
jgi:hypothetical protein